MSTTAPVRILGAALAAAAFVLPPAHAQNATTVPVGAVTLTIPGATSSSNPRYSHISIPLQESPILVAAVISTTSNSVTLNASISSSFGASNPHYLRLKTGAHQGRVFQILSNSANTLNLNTQGSDLNNLTPPIALNTDTAEIVPADTLNSIFGNLPMGGANAASADQVWIWSPTSSAYSKYFYSTTNQRWQDTSFGANANNVVIRPDSGVVFMRRATSNLSIQFLGSVLAAAPQIRVMNSGFTQISGGFPINTTLAALQLNTNGNWVSSNSASSADQVWIWNPSTSSFSKYYYHSGNQRWQDTFFGANANNVAIQSGSSIQIKRVSTGNLTFSTYTLPLPYSL